MNVIDGVQQFQKLSGRNVAGNFLRLDVPFSDL